MEDKVSERELGGLSTVRLSSGRVLILVRGAGGEDPSVDKRGLERVDRSGEGVEEVRIGLDVGIDRLCKNGGVEGGEGGRG